MQKMILKSMITAWLETASFLGFVGLFFLIYVHENASNEIDFLKNHLDEAMLKSVIKGVFITFCSVATILMILNIIREIKNSKSRS